MLADVQGIVFRIVGFQVIATVVVAVFAWFIAGTGAAVSALLGGRPALCPTGLALRLAVAARRPGGADVATFFVGEFLRFNHHRGCRAGGVGLAGRGLVGDDRCDHRRFEKLSDCASVPLGGVAQERRKLHMATVKLRPRPNISFTT